MPEDEEDPGSKEAICTTARSLDSTGRYRLPFGGAGTGRASSASSIPPFSISSRGTAANAKKGITVRSRVQRHAEPPAQPASDPDPRGAW
jgi:hypothetical protein